ncbi:MAG: BACON domain-containing protein [Alloprevotella sp.]
MNDLQRNKSLLPHRFDGIRRTTRQTWLGKAFSRQLLICLLLTSCGGDDEDMPPVWEPDYADYQIECTVTQQTFPCAGGEANVTLSLAAYDDNGRRYEYEQVGAFEVDAPDWLEVERKSNSEFLIRVPANSSFSSRSGEVTFSCYVNYSYRFEKTITIEQDKSDKKLKYESIQFSSAGNPEEWLTENGWHLGFELGWAFVYVTTADGQAPQGIKTADWIEEVRVNETSSTSHPDGSKIWRVGFLCYGNYTPETRSTEVWVRHGEEELGPFVIEQEKFHTLAYPSFTWLDDHSNISSNGGELFLFLDCYNEEEPWISIDGSWARVKSVNKAYTDWDKYMNKYCTRWRFIIQIDKNYGDYRTCNYYCGNASGENYGPFQFGQQGSGGGGGSGSGGYDQTKYFSATAWLETSGGYDHTMTLENVVDHLNQYGVLIYKSGSRYYFKNFEDEIVYVTPSSSPSTYRYYSDYEAGDKYNNYQTKKAIIYLRFAFSAF